MNSFLVEIDLGEKENFATYMAPDDDIKAQFKFSMNSDGYMMFKENIPIKTRIAFEAIDSVYSV